MYELNFRPIEDLPEEREKAKSYWAGDRSQGKEYYGGVPYYADFLAQFLVGLGSNSFFEFGCFAGRNLALIEKLARERNRAAILGGFDINADAVEKSKFVAPNAAIQIGDDESLWQLDENSWDAVFTVSVLDHIPNISRAIDALIRISSKYLVILEPHMEGKYGAVTDVRNPVDSEANGAKSAAPYSYIHNYDREFAGKPVRQFIDVPLPTFIEKLGPIYRLRVFAKTECSQLVEHINSSGEKWAITCDDVLAQRWVDYFDNAVIQDNVARRLWLAFDDDSLENAIQSAGDIDWIITNTRLFDKCGALIEKGFGAGIYDGYLLAMGRDLPPIEPENDGTLDYLRVSESFDSALRDFELTAIAERNSLKQTSIDLEAKHQECRRLRNDLHSAKNSLKKLEGSIAYQFSRNLVDALSKPGKDTLMLPIRVLNLAKRGVKKRLKKLDEPLIEVPCSITGFAGETLSFYCGKSTYLNIDDGTAYFSLPAKTNAYLTTHDGSGLALPPREDRFKLQPDTTYVISGEFEATGGVELIRLIEYDNKGAQVEHHAKTNSGVISMFLRTHPNHHKLAIAFKLKGEGSLKIKNIEVAKRWFPNCFTKPKANVADKPVVASILDPFSHECFNYEMNLVPVTKENWRREMDEARPVMLLVESAWQGNNGNWRNILTKYGEDPNNPLAQLVRNCRMMDIPTVFWNKEDPPDFETFIDLAKDFDWVFTTDANCVPQYKERCGHDRIFALPFAAQPAIHNPIGKQEIDEYDIAFAGTWYKRKFLERSKYMEMLFTAAARHNLFIFNRRSDWHKDDTYDFPESLKPYVYPKIPYEEVLNSHRIFKLYLNTNSVMDSPTMFSRRVFEVLASATPVVSTPSVGVEEMFGDLVPVVKSREQAEDVLDKLLGDEWYRKKLGHRGFRKVMTEDTFDKRVEFIFSKVGMSGLLPHTRRPKVSVVVPTNRPGNIQNIRDNFERQNYPDLELIVVLNNDSINKSEVEKVFNGMSNVKIVQISEKYTLGECLNLSVKHADGEFWAKLDDDDLYCENYLSDQMLAFKYTEADIVGKETHFVYFEGSNKLVLHHPGREHRYTDFISGATLLARKRVFDKALFPKKTAGEDTHFLKECQALGFKIYATDCFNFVLKRKGDSNVHSWKIDESEFRKPEDRQVSEGLDVNYIEC